MENERRFYVYMYLNIDNIPIYIGKGTGQRKIQHLRNAKNTAKKTHFLNWIRKHLKEIKEDSDVVIYKDNLTQEESLKLENLLITSIGRRDKNEGPLLNKTDGGDGGTGRIVTEKEREWRREFSKTLWNDERKKEWSEHLKGRVSSKETNEKISNSLKGRKLSEEVKNKISNSLIGKMAGKLNPMFGVKLSDERKEQIGKSSKLMWADEKFRNKQNRKGLNNANSKYVYTISINGNTYKNVYSLKDFFKDYKDINYKSIKITFSNTKSEKINYKGIQVLRYKYL